MNSEIVMYKTEDGLTKIEVTFDNDTVWFSIDLMADLFQRDRSVIVKYIRNIFKIVCLALIFFVIFRFNIENGD